MTTTRLMRAEWQKLTSTASFWVSMAVVAALCPVATIANVFSTQNGPLGSNEQIHHVLAVSAVTSLAMLALGIAAMANEYRHGTIAATFLVTPRRHGVVTAKLAVIGLTGVVVGAAAFTLTLAIAVPALSARGVHHLAGDTPWLLLGTALATGLFGLLGVAVGALFRNTVVAVIGALAWSFVIEGAILQVVAPKLDKWLPTGANIAVTRSSDVSAKLLDPWLAAAVLVGYAVVLAAVAIRFTVRRDVA